MLMSNEALQKCFHELSHVAYLLEHVKVLHDKQSDSDQEFNIIIKNNCASEGHNALRQNHIATKYNKDYDSTITADNCAKCDVNNKNNYWSQTEKFLEPCERLKDLHMERSQLECLEQAEQTEHIQKIFACESDLCKTRNREKTNNKLCELREHTAALKKVCLPRILKSNNVKELENLGNVINAIQGELEEHVSRQLIDFYNYMKSKESAEIHKILEHRQIVPMGYEGLSWSSIETHNGKIKEGEESVRQSTSKITSSNQQFINEEIVDEYELCHESNNNKKEDLQFQFRRDNTNSSSHRNKKGVNDIATENDALIVKDNAQLALRSFVYFLLECVMKKTSASRGAVYICINAREMEKVGMTSGTSILSNNPISDKKDCSAFLTNEINRGPRFIERIAEIRCQKALPERVSFASTTTLTTAIVSNIAVNLTCNEGRAHNAHCREEDKCNSNSKNEQSVQSGSSSLCKEHSKNIQEQWSQINVHTALIFPIGNFGCLVIADKIKHNSYGKFNIIDEHVMWSTAKLFSALLSRYSPNIFLLKNSDNNKIKVCNLWHSVQELAVNKNKSLQIIKNKEQENSIANIDDYNEDCYSERATIIRTSNVKYEKNCSYNEENNAAESREALRSYKECTQFNPNEVFQEGAEYIRDVESLWTRSIGENQVLKQIIEEQSNEIQMRDGRINDLINKVKKLNVQVAHLQRNATSCKKSPNRST